MAMPKKMVAGSAVGLFGGIIALAVMAATWDGTLDCIVKVGLDMLVSVSFFAAAGTFMKYSPVQGSTMVVLSALAVAFTLVALIAVGVYNKDFGNGNAHLFVAYVFFLFTAIAAILSGYGDYHEKKTIPTAITVVASVVGLFAYATCSLALAEVVIVVCILIWAAAQGVKLAMEKA